MHLLGGIDITGRMRVRRDFMMRQRGKWEVTDVDAIALLTRAVPCMREIRRSTTSVPSEVFRMLVAFGISVLDPGSPNDSARPKDGRDEQGVPDGVKPLIPRTVILLVHEDDADKMVRQRPIWYFTSARLLTLKDMSITPGTSTLRTWQ